MYIKEIEINNFRGLNIQIVNLKKRFLIIGKNDSGKSNFCYAIRKVLDYKTRRQPLVESDSTNLNKMDILIKMVLDLSAISSNNRAILKEYVDVNDDGTETLTIEFNATFNHDIQAYDEYIIFGSLDKTEPKSAAIGNCLDKVVDIIYVYPNYDLSRDTKNYFSYHKLLNEKANLAIGQDISDSIIKLNESISNDSAIKNMQDELNNIGSMKEFFGDIDFLIKSDFELSNIYKSLDIVPCVLNDKKINIGDGKSKTLALLLQKLIKEKHKEKIIILEEPENHLFPLLQKQYASILDDFFSGQTIVTTHSPSIIDFRKTEEIFKFNYEIDEKTKERKFNCFRVNVDGKEIYKKFGYSINEEIAESFFYNEVLLIEGYSEKMFYNILINSDDEFRKIVLNRGVGFICVYGVDFKPSKEILESLGIKVHILTDNDYYQSGKDDDEYVYAGLKRAFSLLDENTIELIRDLAGIDIKENTFNVINNSPEHISFKKNVPSLVDVLKVYNIYVHEGQENGFENAFAEFVGLKEDKKTDVIEILSQRKMKNLHKYLIDNDIVLKVNDRNQKNILVEFLYDNRP